VSTIIFCFPLKIENGKCNMNIPFSIFHNNDQEGQHPLTGQRAANFRLLANQRGERRLMT